MINIHPVRGYGHDLALLKPGYLHVNGAPVIEDEYVRVHPVTGEIDFVHSGQRQLEVRTVISAVQRKLNALPEKTEFRTEHEWCDGMYKRTLYIPKGTLLVGKVHKQPCFNFVLSGDIAILTETGAKRVKAGFHMASPAGIQKLGYANEDTVFVNVFRTDEVNIETIEDALTWESFDLIPLAIEGDKSCQ